MSNLLKSDYLWKHKQQVNETEIEARIVLKVSHAVAVKPENPIKSLLENLHFFCHHPIVTVPVRQN